PDRPGAVAPRADRARGRPGRRTLRRARGPRPGRRATRPVDGLRRHEDAGADRADLRRSVRVPSPSPAAGPGAGMTPTNPPEPTREPDGAPPPATQAGPAPTAGTEAARPDVRAVPLHTFLGYFLGLGTWGFGGPIATVGYMQRDVVERRSWTSRQDFLDGVA